jgi:hypothetical protein
MPREFLLLKHSAIRRTNIYGYGSQLDFVQLDVFTRMPLAGNPLAVFTDARGLTDKQMQALAPGFLYYKKPLVRPTGIDYPGMQQSNTGNAGRSGHWVSVKRNIWMVGIEHAREVVCCRVPNG